jgi:hypothetical protein
MKILNHRGVDVRFVNDFGNTPTKYDEGFYILVSGGDAVRDTTEKQWVRIYTTTPSKEYFEGYIDALIEMGNI